VIKAPANRGRRHGSLETEDLDPPARSYSMLV
jgi:hypothetical protein